MKDKNTGLSGSFSGTFSFVFAFPLGLFIQGLLYNLLVKQPSTPHQHLPLVFSMTHVSSKVHCYVEGGEGVQYIIVYKLSNIPAEYQNTRMMEECGLN